MSCSISARSASAFCVLVFEVACGDVGYQHDLLVYVVEGDYLVEQHEVNVLEPLLVLRVEVQGGFAVFYVVVGEVPHQTSGERREALQLRAGVLLHEFLDVRRRVRLVRGLGLSGNDVLNGEFAVGAGKLQLGVVAEEGVASPFFLVLDAFKYVNMAADSAELFSTSIGVVKSESISRQTGIMLYPVSSFAFSRVGFSMIMFLSCKTKTPPLNAENLCF